MDFTEALTKTINKLVGDLKSEEQLREVLKVKLTKKEFKVFVAIETNVSMEDICTEIHVDEERVQEIYKSTCKKINQEKIKKELTN